MKLKSLICEIQDVKMMEDHSIINHVGRILEIIIGIGSLGGTKQDDEVIWKILKSLTPSFKSIAQMIQLEMPCTKDFTKETLLEILESEKVNHRWFGDLERV